MHTLSPTVYCGAPAHRVYGPRGMERAIFNTESLKVLFRERSPNNIVQFYKQTNLLDKL